MSTKHYSAKYTNQYNAVTSKLQSPSPVGPSPSPKNKAHDIYSAAVSTAYSGYIRTAIG